MKTNVQVIAPNIKQAQKVVRCTRKQIIDGYMQAEKPYEVCVHTCMGGYMEFLRLEQGIMFEDNAKMVAEEYAKSWGKSDNFKGVCVRKQGIVIYEVAI